MLNSTETVFFELNFKMSRGKGISYCFIAPYGIIYIANNTKYSTYLRTRCHKLYRTNYLIEH